MMPLSEDTYDAQKEFRRAPTVPSRPIQSLSDPLRFLVELLAEFVGQRLQQPLQRDIGPAQVVLILLSVEIRGAIVVRRLSTASHCVGQIRSEVATTSRRIRICGASQED